MHDQSPVAALFARLPAGTATHVAELLGRLPVRLRIARPRRTKLGDHRPPGRGWTMHRISINDDLNPYAFLTTLLHEMERRGARWGLQTMCCAGGLGTATLLERMD